MSGRRFVLVSRRNDGEVQDGSLAPGGFWDCSSCFGYSGRLRIATFAEVPISNSASARKTPAATTNPNLNARVTFTFS
jgi:hypothetical protein